MTTTAWTYVAYLAIGIGITAWVAGTLRKYGHVFLGDGKPAQRELADALCHLLVVGFYLVNLGVISFALKIERGVTDAQSAIEVLSTKIGTVLVAIGGMHFVILVIFNSVRKSTQLRRLEGDHQPVVAEVVPGRSRAVS